MDDTERKALALVNEVCEEWNNRLYTEEDARDRVHPIEALCRAIEHHEAFRQEVSDAMLVLQEFITGSRDHKRGSRTDSVRLADGRSVEFARFIIAKPDPLVEVWDKAMRPELDADKLDAFRELLDKRGGKIVWGEG